MNKFKVGDKVVRVSESFGKAIKGRVYEVSGVSDKNEWTVSYGINLKGHAVEGEGNFNYEASNFELYVDGVLSPLEAAEAMLKDKDIEFLSDVSGEWCKVGRPYSQQCLKTLSKFKLRLKPKTIVINDVELVASINTKSLGYPSKVYGVNFSRKSVYDTTGHTDRGLFWATEEDAQKALDAMLIPFNNLTKGDK